MIYKFLSLFAAFCIWAAIGGFICLLVENILPGAMHGVYSHARIWNYWSVAG